MHVLPKLEYVAKIAIALAAIAFLLALVTAPRLGIDGPDHLRWLAMFADQFWDGTVYPRWFPDAFAGLGAPTFYFYPPLTYWLGVPFFPWLTELGEIRAFFIFGGVLSAASCLSFRYFARLEGAGGSLSLWAGVLYTVAPYRLYDLFPRSGLSAHAAMIFIPLVFAGIRGLSNGRQPAHISFAWLAIAWMLLLLSNIPTALITGSVIIVYWLVLALQRKRGVLHILAGLGIGTLLASFYLVPIPLLSPLVQFQHLAVEDSFGVIGLAERFMRGVLITQGFNVILSYATCLLILTVLTLQWKQQRGIVDSMLLVMCGLVLFAQMEYLSGVVWQIPIASRLFQFPYRWSMYTVFLISTAYVVITKSSLRPTVVSAVIVTALASMFLSMLVVFDIQKNPRAAYRTPYEPPEYATKYTLSDWHRTVELVGSLRQQPNIVTSRPLAASEIIQITERDGAELEIHSRLDTEVDVRLRSWYWPYWSLHDERGKTVTLAPDSLGLTVATFPAGDHNLRLTLESSDAERWGSWGSLLGMGLLVGYVAMLRRRTSLSRGEP